MVPNFFAGLIVFYQTVCPKCRANVWALPVDQAIAPQGQPDEAAGVTLHGAGYAGWPPIIEFGDLVGFLCQSKDLFFYVTLYDLIMRVQVWPYKIVCHSFHDWISCFYELMRLILLTCIYQSTAQLLLSLLVAAVVVFSCHWYDPLLHVAALSMFHTAEPNGMREALCFVPQDKHNDMYNSNMKLQRSNDPFLALTDRNLFRLIIVSPFLWKIINLPSFFPPDGGEAPVRHFAFVLKLGLPGHS